LRSDHCSSVKSLGYCWVRILYYTQLCSWTPPYRTDSKRLHKRVYHWHALTPKVDQFGRGNRTHLLDVATKVRYEEFKWLIGHGVSRMQAKHGRY
jgi:hypothetical protein